MYLILNVLSNITNFRFFIPTDAHELYFLNSDHLCGRFAVVECVELVKTIRNTSSKKCLLIWNLVLFNNYQHNSQIYHNVIVFCSSDWPFMAFSQRNLVSKVSRKLSKNFLFLIKVLAGPWFTQNWHSSIPSDK